MLSNKRGFSEAKSCLKGQKHAELHPAVPIGPISFMVYLPWRLRKHGKLVHFSPSLTCVHWPSILLMTCLFGVSMKSRSEPRLLDISGRGHSSKTGLKNHKKETHGHFFSTHALAESPASFKFILQLIFISSWRNAFIEAFGVRRIVASVRSIRLRQRSDEASGSQLLQGLGVARPQPVQEKRNNRKEQKLNNKLNNCRAKQINLNGIVKEKLNR